LEHQKSEPSTMASVIEQICAKVAVLLIRPIPSCVTVKPYLTKPSLSCNGVISIISRQASSFSKSSMNLPVKPSTSTAQSKLRDPDETSPEPSTKIVLQAAPSNKKEKAKVMKRLHKFNKEMFGELIESKKEKTQRVKKETKTLKKESKSTMKKPPQSAMIFDPTTYYTYDDKVNDNESNRVLFQPPPRKTRTPKSLPASESLRIPGPRQTKGTSRDDDNQTSSTPQILSSQKSLDSEINWALKTSPKMIKVIGISPNNDQDSQKNDKKLEPRVNHSKPLQLPSVSKILNLTMPQEQVEALERWQAKMTSELGVEGFRLYKESK
jgi:hypothetical protein